MKISEEIHLQGIAIAPGIAEGHLHFFSKRTDLVHPRMTSFPYSHEWEISRLHRALSKAADQIFELQTSLSKNNMKEGARLLEAHLEIIRDPYFIEKTESLIREEQSAEEALKKHCSYLQKRFQGTREFHLSERFSEVRDVADKVLRFLIEDTTCPYESIPDNSIVAIKNLTPLVALEAPKGKVKGFISQEGGPAAHAAIIAKARKIPYISGIDLVAYPARTPIILDGTTGTAIVDPLPFTHKKFQAKAKKYQSRFTKTPLLDSETYDGYKIRVSASITDAEDIESFGKKISGIGLFRSEYVVLPRDSFPSEEDQFEVYKKILQQTPRFPVVIRTFDLSGDKTVPSKFFGEDHPHNISRTLQYFLKEKGLFKSQIRALLRAAVFGNLGILLPMVSGLSDLREAKKLVLETSLELKKEGIPFCSNVRIGAMIEIPSAAIIADLIAKECDFLSIGTNDLMQYAFAPRDTEDRHYRPVNPSMLRFIKLIVSEANHKGVPVAICGEMASDPKMTPLLIGLGVHELSCSLTKVEDVISALRSCSIIEASELAEKALAATTADEIASLLEEQAISSVTLARKTIEVY